MYHRPKGGKERNKENILVYSAMSKCAHFGSVCSLCVPSDSSSLLMDQQTIMPTFFVRLRRADRQ